MNSKRDYNVETKDTHDRNYAYHFDGSTCMIKSFGSFFNMGSLLDSDSFKGGFARKFLSCFDAITGTKTSGIDCRCACSSDALERDAVAATLDLIHRPEIFLMRERAGLIRISSAVIAQMLALEKFCLRRPCP